MRFQLILCAALGLLSVAFSQPILPTHRMALGLSYEPESGCVFIVFVHHIKVHCRLTDTGLPVEIVGDSFLAGRAIVRWTEKTDTNGFIYVLAEDRSLPTSDTELFVVSRTAAPKWVNSTAVSVGSSGISVNKRTDFHLTADRTRIYFIGQATNQGFGLYSFNSTASSVPPKREVALVVPPSGSLREPLFAEHAGFAGLFFRAFDAASPNVASLFAFDFASRTALRIEFQTTDASATTVEVFGPVQIRATSGFTTVGWVAHQHNGTHDLLFDCFYNATASSTQQCRSVAIAGFAPSFHGIASSGFSMYLFSSNIFFVFDRAGQTRIRDTPQPVVDVVHDGDFGSQVFVVCYGSSYFLGTPRLAGLVTVATEFSPDRTSTKIGVANNTFFYTAADGFAFDVAILASIDPTSLASFDDPKRTTLLSCTSESRYADNTFGVSVMYLPSPRNEFALVTMFEDGAKLMYYASRDFDVVASTPLFENTIAEPLNRQPNDISLVAKLSENYLLLRGHFATHIPVGLFAASRDNVSAPFVGSLIIPEGSSSCLPSFDTQAIATSVAPSGEYVIFSNFVFSGNSSVEAYYLNLRNKSAPAIRLMDSLSGNRLTWAINDRIDSGDLPVIHLPNDQFCIIANNNSDIRSPSRYIFCFDKGTHISTASFHPAGPLGNSIDYAVAPVANGSSTMMMYYVCFVNGGTGPCAYRPFASSTELGPRTSSGDTALLQLPHSVVSYSVDNTTASTLAELVGGSIVSSSTTTYTAYRAAAAVPAGSIYGKFVLLGERFRDFVFDRCISASECYRQVVCPECVANTSRFSTLEFCGTATKGAAFAQQLTDVGVDQPTQIMYASITGRLVTLLTLQHSEYRSCKMVSSDPAVVVVITSTSIRAILADQLIEVEGSAENSTLIFELPRDPAIVDPVFFMDAPKGRQLMVTLQRNQTEWSPLEENQNVVLLPKTFCVSNDQCPQGQNCTYGICSTRQQPTAAECIPPAPAEAICINGVWFVPRNVSNNGNSTVGGATVITGALIAGSNGTLSFSSGATLNITGCAQFGGILQVTVEAPPTSGDQVVELINFDSYCGGQTQFDSAQLTVVGGDSCAKQQVKAIQYNSRSVSVLFAWDTSDCNIAPDGTIIPLTPSRAGTPSDGGVGGGDALGLPIGAIIGIVVGIVAIAVAIALLSVFWTKFRRVIRPYEARETRKEALDRRTREDAAAVDN